MGGVRPLLVLGWLLLSLSAEEVRTLPRLTVGTADEWIYIGTETENGERGLRVAARNSKTGKVSESYPAATSARVGALAVSPDYRTLIAANWVKEFNGESSGALTAFDVDRLTCRLRFLSQVGSGGQRPSRPQFLKNGKGILVANRFGGTLGLFPILENGALGDSSDLLQLKGDAARKESTRPMEAVLSADGAWVLVPDSSSDMVWQYPVDPSTRSLRGNAGGKLPFPKGSSPVACVVSEKNDRAYVLLQGRSAVAVCRFTPRDGLGEIIQEAEIPEDPNQEGKGVGRQIFLSPDGTTLDVLCTLNPSLVQWQVEKRNGELKDPVRLGLKGTDPRSAWFDPNGRWMLIPHKADGFIETVAFDPKTNEPSLNPAWLDVPEPLCVVVVPRIRTEAKP